MFLAECLVVDFQINELNKRMSAIESLLSRLEEKMTPDDEVRQEVHFHNKAPLTLKL